MKAIRIHHPGGPDVLQYEDVPDPTPGDGQALVRLHAAGVNPVEAYVRAGTYPIKIPTPYIPGVEGAGVIEAVGPNVIDLAVGQRVWVSQTASGRMQGAYAEKCVADAAFVHALPDALGFEQGAAINVAFVTAHRALFDRAALKPGEVVLVHGATGGVGLPAVQIAAAHGAIVLGTGSTPEGRQLAEKMGAAKTFDHGDDGYLDRIKAATDGRGPDVIIEMLADRNLDKDLRLVANDGRIVVIGSRGRVEIDPRTTMTKECTVSGVTYWGNGGPTLMPALAAVAAGVQSGAYVPIVGQTFTLADAAKAHEAVMNGGGARGKIVLTM